MKEYNSKVVQVTISLLCREDLVILDQKYGEQEQPPPCVHEEESTWKEEQGQ